MSYQNYNPLEKAIKLLKKVLEITRRVVPRKPSVGAGLYKNLIIYHIHTIKINPLKRKPMRLPIPCLEDNGKNCTQENPISLDWKLYGRKFV